MNDSEVDHLLDMIEYIWGYSTLYISLQLFQVFPGDKHV